MRDVFFVLLVSSSVVRIRNIHLYSGLDQTDEGDQDGETEDC